jgi:hypothetical protein
MKSFAALAKHLGTEGKHKIDGLYPRKPRACFCGATFANRGHLANHLAGTKDLKTHYVLSQLKESADAHRS